MFLRNILKVSKAFVIIGWAERERIRAEKHVIPSDTETENGKERQRESDGERKSDARDMRYFAKQIVLGINVNIGVCARFYCVFFSSSFFLSLLLVYKNILTPSHSVFHFFLLSSTPFFLSFVREIDKSRI